VPPRLAAFLSRVPASLNTCWPVGLILLLALGVRNACVDFVFSPKGIFYLDSDAYTRMFRVKLLSTSPLTPIHQHWFENYPAGSPSHCTAPLDYLLLVFSWILHPFYPDALDRAGALLPPLVAAALLALYWYWSAPVFARTARLAGLFLLAICTPLAWAHNIGRPDHQALTVAFIGAGLLTEALRLANKSSRHWMILGGFSWGMALWVSLYEPLISLLFCSILSAALCGKEFLAGRRTWLAGFLPPLALLLLIEKPGWMPETTSPENVELMKNFWSGIGELQHLGITHLWLWYGGWLVAAPAILYFGWRSGVIRGRITLFIGVVIAALTVATIWQLRWSPFLGFALCSFVVPVFFMLPGRLWHWATALLLTLPIFYYHSMESVRKPAIPEQAGLRQLARSISPGGSILASWWHSPALLYFSGQPIVASSAHTTIEGIRDSSLFFLTHDWREAEKILVARQVRWVVIGDANRTLADAERILHGKNLPLETIHKSAYYHHSMASRLAQVTQVPTPLKLRSVVSGWRLYEYAPEGATY